MDINIIRLWTWLNKDKKFLKNEVHARLFPAQLSKNQLEEPHIKKSITEKGYFDVQNEISHYNLNTLELFVEKGFVVKYVDTFHKISVFYEYFAYAPNLDPDGKMGISGPRSINDFNMLLDSKQFSNFEKTAAELKNQIDLGYHRHIDHFEYEVLFEYQTEVYEVKDRYLDIMELSYNPGSDSYDIIIVEPIINESKAGPTKGRKILRKTDINFMDGSAAIDPIIDEIEWKREFIGYTIHNKEAYKILNTNTESRAEIKVENNKLNYLENEIFDIHNLFSRIFEDSVADYLREKEYNRVIPRHKLDLFDSDIDVYAESGSREIRKLYCECKFKVYDQELTNSDLDQLIEKIKIIGNNKKKGMSSEYWLVTNTSKIPQHVKDIAKQNKIKIHLASINNNWRRRATWSVHKIEKIV
jgi:hypothetical protein